MRRLRIAVVTPYFPTRSAPHGGHSTYQTLRMMPPSAEVQVFCPVATYLAWMQPRTYKFNRAVADFSPPGVQVRYYPYPALPVVTRPVNPFTCRLQFQSDLRAFRPDVVLSYWLYPEGRAAVTAAHRIGVPAIVCSIGSDLRCISDFFARRAVRGTLIDAEFVLTVSHELRQLALALDATPERSAVILNGCDLSIFHPASRGDARRRLGISLECPTIVFVGALIAAKGLNELLEAQRILTRKHPNLQVYCVGEGSLRPYLEQAAAASGLSSRFHLPGPTNSYGVAEWIAASDVFCLPSHSEGCPNVVIEAIASGRPVVAAAVGGVPELLTPQSGVLVQPKDHNGLAAGLDSALGRSWDAAQISAAFSRSWEDVALETFEVCQKTAAAGLHKRS